MSSMSMPQDRYKRNTFSLGMTIALASWTMVFITLLWGYVVIRMRTGVWLEAYMTQDILSVAISNTVILVASAYALRRDKLFLSVCAAVLFLAGQVCLWKMALRHGLHWQQNTAGSFFYLLSGFHALHIVGGVIALFVLWVKPTLKGTSTSVGIRYFWDFLMIIWVVMFVLMFIVR